MIEYSYEGLDLQGNEKVSGTIAGASVIEAKSMLEQQNIIVNKIKPLNSATAKYNFFKNYTKLVNVFTEELYSFLSSGIELKVALGLMKEKTDDKDISKLIDKVLSDLSNGKSFYYSLNNQKIVPFSFYYLESVKIAEENNNIPYVLEKLIEYQENKEADKDSVSQALTYPAIVLAVSSFVLVYLMTSVVPKIVAMFDTNNQELPRITSIVISISEYLTANYIYLTVSLIAIIMLITFLYKFSPKFKYLIHYFFLKVPFIGSLIQNKELGRFLYLLYLLLNAKVPPNKALKLSENIIENLVLKKEFKDNLNLLKDGKSIEDAFKSSKMISKDFLNFIFLSEYNNNMKDIAHKTSQKLSKQSAKRVKRFIAALEPMTMIVVGSIIGVIVISILLPIFNLNIG